MSHQAARTLSALATPGEGSSVDPLPTIGLAWLVRLRWGAVVSQLAVLGLGTAMLGPPDDLAPILGLIAATPITNLVLTRHKRSTPRASLTLVSVVLVLDALVLTALLHLSGGATNPFTVFYLVHVALAAVLLDARGAWLLTAITSAGFASLFLFPAEGAAHAHHHAGMDHGGGSFSLHLQGMWFSYTLAAAFVGYFVSRTARALADREARVLELTRAAARTDRLASLTTFAAGAAHELGTPLGTIAIVAKELERAAAAGMVDAASVVDDARLLRQETERCRLVLGRLAAGAGELQGEGVSRTAVSTVLARLRDELGDARASRLDVAADADANANANANDELAVRAPPLALIQVLASLVRNGLEANDEAGRSLPVTISVQAEPTGVVFRVDDHGAGVREPALSRLGEPFFTTKAPGKGLGLGLFLACAFAEQIGGRLDVSTRPEGGARFALLVPRGTT